MLWSHNSSGHVPPSAKPFPSPLMPPRLELTAAVRSELSVSAPRRCSTNRDALMPEAAALLGQKPLGGLEIRAFQRSLLHISWCGRLSQCSVTLAVMVAFLQIAFQARTAPSPCGNGPDPALADTRDTHHEAGW